MGTLDGKSAIVTGAGRGIGRAIALRLAQSGAWVGVVDIDPETSGSVTAEIRKSGGQAEPFRVDITDFKAVKSCVDQIEAKRKSIDILVNNAGWDRILNFHQMTQEFWEKVIDINFRGPIHFCRAVVEGMIREKRGKIVSISSDAGRVGSSGESVYSGCKGGIIAFSKTLARELARYGITVNIVCPGPANTQFLKDVTAGEMGAKIIDAMIKATPMRRLVQPEEIAAAVHFFASSDADFVTGQVLSVSGGLTMAG